MGAEPRFLGDGAGSLETGKYSDLIVGDADALHNMPHFRRDSQAVYSQLVYAAKSTDVRHVMCHGRWLMRDRELLTVDVTESLEQAREYATRVDDFLIAHENDVLSKLVAVGGLERSESFEVQVKAIIPEAATVHTLLDHPDVEVLRDVHYRQYDTYFLFNDPDMGRVRYREDERVDEKGEVTEVRARLTFTMPEKEREFNSAVLLSHSRFIAPADRPLRFYKEYFQASETFEMGKDRSRWHIHYQGVLYYINVDKMVKPARSETFIEIKSRTWSLEDAEHKADGIRRMMELLGISAQDAVQQEYIDMHRS